MESKRQLLTLPCFALTSRSIMVYLMENFAPDNPLYPKDDAHKTAVDQILEYDLFSVYKPISFYVVSFNFILWRGLSWCFSQTLCFPGADLMHIYINISLKKHWFFLFVELTLYFYRTRLKNSNRGYRSPFTELFAHDQLSTPIVSQKMYACHISNHA